MEINYKLYSDGTKYSLEIFGELNEDSDFSQLSMPEASEIFVNFEGVIRIQSCGIREWINAISLYPKAQVYYKNCPKIIIDQINMIVGFLPARGIVESFYVPYYSNNFGHEKFILFSRGKEFDAHGIISLPEVKDEEGNIYELDVTEEKYFKFLYKKAA